MHYLYRITNLLNNKFYIGVRSYKGKNYRNDKYMGSGLNIKHAINKYGIDNFKKEVLMFCESKLYAYLILSILVDQLFIKRCDTYNIAMGGCGGATSIGKHHSQLTKYKMSAARKGKIHSELTKKKMCDSKKINNIWCGKRHSQLTILKMKTAHKNMSNETKYKLSIAQTGKHHSQLTKDKMSESRRGIIPWNKGIPRSEWINGKKQR